MKFKSIINDVCCDARIRDGVFRLENADHVFILQEYLEKAGYSLDEILDKTAKLFEAGRFPDRQAYNKDGILVTFPSKDYRDRAVDKGTHFAENPKKNTGTLFSPDDNGGLATSDVTKPAEPGAEENPASAAKTGTVSLDQELNQKIAGDDADDKRSAKDKVQDAQAVKSMLTGDMPLVNFSIDEAVSLGYVNRGFDWFDSDGKLVGEQIYDESTGSVTIQAERGVPMRRKNSKQSAEKSTKEKPPEKKAANSDKVVANMECNAQQMEIHIDQEFGGQNTGDRTAQIIVDGLKSKFGIVSSKLLGNLECRITNPIFANIKGTSKTDLIFYGKGSKVKASLKDKAAQICSAQNAEINSVVSSVLKETNESKAVMDEVSSFIMHGLEKGYYISLQDEAKETLNKALTSAIKGQASIDDIKKQAEDVKKIIRKNIDFVEGGDIPVDVTNVMLKLNSLFVQQPRRTLIIEELATGKRRFASSSEPPDCVADHMMTWMCGGNFHMYTVMDFIKANDKNISFRFSNRGGTRGISIRGDIKSKMKEYIGENQLDEGAMDVINQMGASITKYFGDVWNKIKSLSGELKNFFIQLWEDVKSGLQSIYESIIKIGKFLKEVALQGWTTFTDWLGFEGHAEGQWVWQMPHSGAAIDDPVEEPINDLDSTATP